MQRLIYQRGVNVLNKACDLAVLQLPNVRELSLETFAGRFVCGVEVKGTSSLPPEFQILQTSEQQYVVFRHTDHVASIRATYTAIWTQWFPTSGYQATKAPTLERHGPEFDGKTGMGGFEIWIAIEKKPSET